MISNVNNYFTKTYQACSSVNIVSDVFKKYAPILNNTYSHVITNRHYYINFLKNAGGLVVATISTILFFQACVAAVKMVIDDRKFVGDMESVTRDGLALQFLNPERQDTKLLVTIAVCQNGLALQFASEKLKGDKELVLRAVTQNRQAFEYASKELQNDPEVRFAALPALPQVRFPIELAIMFPPPNMSNEDETSPSFLG